MEAPATPRPAGFTGRLIARASLLMGLGAVLLLAGLGLHWLGSANTDLPGLWELERDGLRLYWPHATGALDQGLSNPALVENAWKLTFLSENGQWDTRVLSLGSLFLQLAAGASLVWALRRILSRGALVLVLLSGLGVLILSPLGARPVPAAAWPSAVVVASVAALLLARDWAMGRGDRGTLLTASAAGLLAVLLGNEGIGVGVAALSWCWFPEAKAADPRRRRDLTAGASALTLAGMGLAWLRMGAHPSWFIVSGEYLFTWPWNQSVTGVIVWLPLILVAFGIRPVPSAPGEEGLLRMLALWGLSQLVLGSAVGIHPWNDAFELLFGVLLIATACMLAWGRGASPARAYALLAGLWVAVVVAGLLQPAGRRANLGPTPDDPFLGQLAREFRQSPGPSDPGQAPDHFLGNPQANGTWLQRILPGSLRSSVALLSATAGKGAFDPAHLPKADGRDQMHALGDYGSPEPGPHRFESEVVSVHGAILQFRVCGLLKPGQTALYLRTEEGKTVQASEVSLDSRTHWRRINFKPPNVPFRVIAENNTPSAEVWLAFTEPVEVETGSWLALKAVRPALALVLLCLGGGCLLAGLLGTVLTEATGAGSPAWDVVPWAALAGYALFLLPHLNVTAAINDAGGYLNSAKLLRSGHVSAAPRMIWGPNQGETDLSPYVPTQFQPLANGRLAPEYPCGFPLEIAAVALVMPMGAAIPVVILGQLILGVLATRQLARLAGLGAGWSWFAATLVGFSAVYLFQGMQPQSDVAAMLWITAAIAWAWSSRERAAYAVFAGLATAMAVLVRPSDLLCAVPVLICMGLSLRRLGLWVLAGLPGACWLLWYNRHMYGSPFATGYGDVSGSFSPRFVLPTLLSYAKWLPLYFTPLIMAGWIGPFVGSTARRLKVALAAWVALLLGFYAFYYCTYDTWFNMRFVLPCMPAAAVLAAIALDWAAREKRIAMFAPKASWRLLAPCTLLVVVTVAWDVVAACNERVLYWTEEAASHAAAARYVARHVPADAIVYAHNATGPLTYYTALTTVRYDSATGSDPAFVDRAAATGRPIYAAVYDWEVAGERNAKVEARPVPGMPGNWTEEGASGLLKLWKLQPAR